MARKLLACALLLVVVMVAGCVLPRYGAIWAPVMDEKSAVAVGDTTVGMDNVGEATAEGIILLGRGDASLTAAMMNGSKGPIRKIHHVDSQELNILGLYAKETIRVYGE